LARSEITETSPTKKKLWKENNPKTPPRILKPTSQELIVFSKIDSKEVGKLTFDEIFPHTTSKEIFFVMDVVGSA